MSAYALVWTGPDGRGCYCPAGGLTRAEAEQAKDRLYEAARDHEISPVVDHRQGPGSDGLSAEASSKVRRGRTVGAAIVPYVFDVAEAFR